MIGYLLKSNKILTISLTKPIINCEYENDLLWNNSVNSQNSINHLINHARILNYLLILTHKGLLKENEIRNGKTQRSIW